MREEDMEGGKEKIKEDEMDGTSGICAKDEKY
jgi:hypothetical protein